MNCHSFFILHPYCLVLQLAFKKKPLPSHIASLIKQLYMYVICSVHVQYNCLSHGYMWDFLLAQGMQFFERLSHYQCMVKNCICSYPRTYIIIMMRQLEKLQKMVKRVKYFRMKLRTYKMIMILGINSATP